MRLGPIGTGAPLPLATGLRRGSGCPAAGALAVREHTRRAVLRCDPGGDDRRYGALFGTRAGTAGGTHSTRLPSALPHAVRPALTASRACSCCDAQNARVGYQTHPFTRAGGARSGQPWNTQS